MAGSRHLKALAAPYYWPILRKKHKWTVKPSPGPHPIEYSLPLLIVVRDVFKYAETGREARKLISEGNFEIDGRIIRDYKFPVGFMDVLHIIPTDEYYRVLPVPTKVIGFVKISKEEAGFKLCRIENKTTVKGGHIQLNLHDGRNVLIRVSDPSNPVEDIYETLGTIQLSLGDNKIMDYIPLREESTLVIISGGRNAGRVGLVKKIHRGMGVKRSIAVVEDKNGNLFQTSLNYVFPIGRDKPLITLPEGAWK
ncbi:30S ribosomal protein S4e [Thermogladius sp. 4427co]|uniref:30S ribosomal protein S4e n=1 Tax=Thermogladius sp. 4427co TaxID=3450718 RepID=UPI003F7A54F5